MSIRKSAAIVGINPNTSFQWRHKILNGLNGELPSKLSGTVEIDEVIIPESFKGNHSKDESFYMGRAPRKRGPKLSERGSLRSVRVLCCLSRREDIFSQVIGRNRPVAEQLIGVLEDKNQQLFCYRAIVPRKVHIKCIIQIITNGLKFNSLCDANVKNNMNILY